MAKKGRPFVYESNEDRPVTISMRLSKELHTRLGRYAKQHRQTVSELIRDGIEWRIGDGDPRGLGDKSGTNTPLEHYGNTERERGAQEAEALQEVRALLARQWEQIQALAQALERQTAPGSNGVSDSNTTMPASDVAISYQEASYTEVVTLTDDATVPLVAEAGAEAETLHEGNTVIQTREAKPRGRKPVLRPGILALLDEHPEGLTAAELKVYLKTEKHIGDTLAGMVRAQLLVKTGTGSGLRYQSASSF